MTTAGDVEGTPWLRLLLLLLLRVWAVAEADAETQWRSQRAQKAFLCRERMEGGGGARCCCYIIMAEAAMEPAWFSSSFSCRWSLIITLLYFVVRTIAALAEA